MFFFPSMCIKRKPIIPPDDSRSAFLRGCNQGQLNAECVQPLPLSSKSWFGKRTNLLY